MESLWNLWRHLRSESFIKLTSSLDKRVDFNEIDFLYLGIFQDSFMHQSNYKSILSESAELKEKWGSCVIIRWYEKKEER